MITFHCPSCGIKLQVPEQMAGVSGPCPHCSANIIAPQLTQPAPMAPQVQPQQAVQQAVAPELQPQTEPYRPEPLQKAAVTSSQSSALNSPSSEEPAPPVEAPMLGKVRRGHHKPSRPRWMKVVFPLAFLMAAAVLVAVILQAAGIVDLWKLGSGGKNTPPVGEGKTPQEEGDVTPAPKSSVTSPASTDTEPVNPDPSAPVSPVPAAVSDPPKEPESPKASEIPSTTPPEGEFPDLSPPPPGDLTTTPSASPKSSDTKSPPQAGSLVKKPRFRANEILDQFIAAKSLEERLPLMTKSTRTQDELMASCLAGSLKPVRSNYFSEMVPRLEDDMRQYLYYIAFEDKEVDRQRKRIVVQLVERPGIHPPRVHADAFIEHYDQWLAAYAKKPSKKIHTFHCIAEARTADLVKNLPGELKKQMIRLVIKSHPRGKPAFDAFLNKKSPLMEKIGPRAEFPYVQPRFCVLSFRWNTEQADYPYIELVDIVTIGWEK